MRRLKNFEESPEGYPVYKKYKADTSTLLSSTKRKSYVGSLAFTVEAGYLGWIHMTNGKDYLLGEGTHDIPDKTAKFKKLELKEGFYHYAFGNYHILHTPAGHLTSADIVDKKGKLQGKLFEGIICFRTTYFEYIENLISQHTQLYSLPVGKKEKLVTIYGNKWSICQESGGPARAIVGPCAIALRTATQSLYEFPTNGYKHPWMIPDKVITFDIDMKNIETSDHQAMDYRIHLVYQIEDKEKAVQWIGSGSLVGHAGTVEPEPKKEIVKLTRDVLNKYTQSNVGTYPLNFLDDNAGKLEGQDTIQSTMIKTKVNEFENKGIKFFEITITTPTNSVLREEKQKIAVSEQRRVADLHASEAAVKEAEAAKIKEVNAAKVQAAKDSSQTEIEKIRADVNHTKAAADLLALKEQAQDEINKKEQIATNERAAKEKADTAILEERKRVLKAEALKKEAELKVEVDSREALTTLLKQQDTALLKEATRQEEARENLEIQEAKAAFNKQTRLTGDQLKLLSQTKIDSKAILEAQIAAAEDELALKTRLYKVKNDIAKLELNTKSELKDEEEKIKLAEANQENTYEQAIENGKRAVQKIKDAAIVDHAEAKSLEGSFAAKAVGETTKAPEIATALTTARLVNQNTNYLQLKLAELGVERAKARAQQMIPAPVHTNNSFFGKQADAAAATSSVVASVLSSGLFGSYIPRGANSAALPVSEDDDVLDGSPSHSSLSPKRSGER